MNQQQKKQHNIIALFAIAMAFLAWMAVKLPMPALPQLAHYFHTSNEVFKVSVTLNLITFSVSQIFWGPLSERYGRKNISIIAYCLTIIGTLLAMLSVNIIMYISGRMIEGFAVGSAAPIGRAVMADSMEKIQMAKTYAWFALAALLPPAVGSVIGGYLLYFFGWRTIFAFFLILATGYLAAIYFYFINTNTPDPQYRTVTETMKSIRYISKQIHFWQYVLCYAMINGFMITYYAAMPYWYVLHFHLAENVYAWLAFLPIGSYLIGTIVTRKLIKRHEMSSILQATLYASILTASILFILAFFITPSIINLNIVIIIMSILSGIITPIVNATLMHDFREHVTVLSAMMSGLRVCGAGFLVLITANIHLQTYWPLSIYLIVLTYLSTIIYTVLKRRSCYLSTQSSVMVTSNRNFFTKTQW